MGELSQDKTLENKDLPPAPPPPSDSVIDPQAMDKPCSCESKADFPNPNSAGMKAYPFVYALGRVQPRFPRPSVEKEFAQAIGRADMAGLTDRQAMHSALSHRHNRYLVRQLCWVLTIEGMETYLLIPRDTADYDLLVEALRPSPKPTDVDVIIGVRGPMATPEICNGLLVPILIFDQTYSFDVDALIKSIPKPEETSAKHFSTAAEDLFYRIMQMADNAGATDEYRALNYLAVRYQAIYVKTAEMYGKNCSLDAVDVHPSRLTGTRKVMDVIFSYTHRQTDVKEKYFVRVDVTEEFPYLVSKMSPYLDR